MSTSSTTLITVLGTLGGTALGLGASLINSWFSHSKSIDKEKADRRRERLELLYSTLLEVRKLYQDILGQALSKLHGNSTKPMQETETLSPIIKSEMLIRLYFPELSPGLQSFDKAKDKIGEEWAGIMIGDFKNYTLPQKQAASSRFLELYNALDDQIASLQKSICQMIEA